MNRLIAIRDFALIILLVAFISSVSKAENLGPFYQKEISGEHFSLSLDDKMVIHSFETDDVMLPMHGDEISKEYLNRFRIDYTKWTPSESNGHIIIYNHGLQSHRAWFFDTAEELVEQGFTIYAFDRIGSGTSSNKIPISNYNPSLIVKPGHIHDWKIFVKTLQEIKNIAKNENPISKIHLWGNSYGAKIVTSYLLMNEDKDISSVVFTTPGLYLNKENMPLPFSIFKFIFSSDQNYFNSPLYETDSDNGASHFTSDPEYFEKIKHDTLSNRKITRRFLIETRSMDKFISKKSNGKSNLGHIPRFYLMVKNDVMMDNEKMIKHINKNSQLAEYKWYSGGDDNRHFLTFTKDKFEALSDIVDFILRH